MKKGDTVMKVRSMGALLVALAFTAGSCRPGDSEVEMTPRPADPFTMEVGDCFNDTEMGVNEVTEVPAVPLSLIHI